MANLLIYSFAGSTNEPTTTASGVWGGPLSKIPDGGLFSLAIGDYGEGWASQPTIIACSSATAAAGAVTGKQYWEFAAAPTSGKKLNLATLTLNAARGGSSTPRGIKIRSSIDSYANDLYSADLSTAVPTWTAISIDLSGAGYQGLTSPITFRFYIWTPTNENSVDADDITLTGTVASLSDVKTFNGVSLVKTANGIT